MDTETIKVFGQIAGIGGLSLGVFLYLFKEVIRKQIFPQLTKQQAYNVIRLILLLISIVVLSGIGAWLYASQLEKTDGNSIVRENGEKDSRFPSTEEFQGLLNGCALGSDLEISANLIGSVADIYDGDRTQGKAVIKNQTKFLESFPEQDRKSAYELYTTCIVKILYPEQKTRKQSVEVGGDVKGDVIQGENVNVDKKIND